MVDHYVAGRSHIPGVPLSYTIENSTRSTGMTHIWIKGRIRYRDTWIRGKRCYRDIWIRGKRCFRDMSIR